MGVSLGKLAPSFARFNPLSRLREIPRQNVPSAAQACFVLVVAGYFVWSIAGQHLAALMLLPLASIQTGLSVLANALSEVLWRSGTVLLLVGSAELLRHRRLYHKDLAMTREEIRQEHKEQEGDPHIKAQVRRIRRDLLRRRMMHEVPKATVVVMNPTHYAVAIRYDSGSMASPRVVAKGRNYLALRIRQSASENDVPIVENPPLARALYKAVEVGSEIPPDFYRAVAEILAYVYRMMGGRRPV
jgi:flagellar biosynthetic protein FlhB